MFISIKGRGQARDTLPFDFVPPPLHFRDGVFSITLKSLRQAQSRNRSLCTKTTLRELEGCLVMIECCYNHVRHTSTRTPPPFFYKTQDLEIWPQKNLYPYSLSTSATLYSGQSRQTAYICELCSSCRSVL